jgi:protein O-GlcNAc transferase
MLTKLIGSFFKHAVWEKVQEKNTTRLFKDAKDAYTAGELRDACKLYEKYLAVFPQDQEALNAFGVCLADIGETERAHAVFKLAYSLDDSNLSAVLNHARYLVDEKKITEALPELVRAQVMVPESPHVSTIMSGVSLLWGDAEAAKGYSLRAWLSNFENIRLANGHLFSSAYSDMAEDMLAAEHGFWAETYAPPSYQLAEPAWSPADESPGKKLRIGYWSPDLRNHSVRYFFRPLLEGHDRNRVELILYHDSIFQEG